MAWKGVITDAGAELITRWAADTTLKIIGASAGSGTVEESELKSQTGLVRYAQEMSIVSREAVKGGTLVKVQLTAPAEKYTLNQIGLFVTVDNSEPIMLALYQNNAGVLIPSQNETEDFVFSFLATLAISNSGNLQIVIDSAAIVSHSTLDEAISAHNNLLNTHLDIRTLIDYNAPKIGDIRISTRDFADDSWLLCPNTDVNENNYPELYYILAAKTDIFTGEWAFASDINTLGVAPIYATDSRGNEYVYFVEDSTPTVYRYKMDLTEMYTFERIKTGPIQFENGLWFVFGEGNDFGKVYYSSDCFESSINELSFDVSGSDESATSSFVRYAGGEWYINFCTNENTNGFSMFHSIDINGEYLRLASTSKLDKDRIIYPTDKVVFENGASLMVFRYTVTTSGITYRRKVLYYNPISDDYSDSNWNYLGMVDSCHVTYLKDIDSVIYTNNNGITMLLKNDGTSVDLGVSDISSLAYFKGFLYLKSSDSIYRYDANALEQASVVKTEYVTENGISASPLRLYMPNGTNSVYYIENDKSLSIPEAHPNSIFKTYIKAK